ncbi:MAG: hypothetical protein AAB600_02015 [Patescibacteria group bacterium]
MKNTQQVLIKVPKETGDDKLRKSRGFELKTKNGYRLDEVVSALQKAIRRNQEERAAFWAYEMFEGGYIKYLWRRLSVIALEDVGIADPFAAVLVNALAQSSERINQKDKVEVLHPGLAVMYLCRAKKSREVDYWLEIVEHKRKLGQKLELEKHELDSHAEKGRTRLRKETKEQGVSYERLVDLEFYYQGALLSNPVSVESDKWKKKVWELRKLDKKKINLRYEPK